jgi:2-oxoisovalerate dehydrogenase E1 component
MGFKFLARLGAGVNPDQMHAERINGYDPLAVIDATRRKKEILKQGLGPVLLDVVTYRLSGHSPSDASSYRTKEELERFQQADAIPAYAKKLTDSKVATAKKLDGIKGKIDGMVFDMFKMAMDLTTSPRETLDSTFCDTVMFSNRKVEKLDDRAPDVNHPLSENPRAKQIAGKARYAYDAAGKLLPDMKVYSIRDALFEAIMHRFYIDPTLVAFGEENRDWGGAFAVYRGMTEALPYHRLFNSPISEAAIVGAAVGYAMAGGRAIAELMYCDFMGRAGDEIFNQLSKWQAMSGGILKMPVVLRISVGAKYGAQHSQDWSALVNHIPGLKVVYPVTPYDAKGMMNAALIGTDPVVFLESQGIYGYGEMFVKTGVPEGYYEIDLSEPSVKKTGKDLTIVTLGPTLYKALKVAETLEADHGVSTEVIDLRTVNPLNYDKLVESVEKTGKLLLTSEAVERGNVMHNVAANLTQMAFDSLDAPPVVLGSRNWVTPGAEMEAMFFPQPSWFLDSIHERIMPLKGYTPVGNRTLGELKRRSRLGV